MRLLEEEVSQGQCSTSMTSHLTSSAEKALLPPLSEYEICRGQSSCFPDSVTAPSIEAVQSPLFRLPYELRRMVFWRSIFFSRSPSPEEIHESNLRAHWEDLPSPLLGTNKQIRNEVKDLLLRNQLFTLRVTCFGATFDMLGLSCFIAQERPKNYDGLPGLRIEIWPPHPDRPVEMFHIYEHIRKLRDKLRAAPQIPKLLIWFKEDKLVKWSEDGKPRRTLQELDEYVRDDMEIVLDLFARITNVKKANVRLPPTLQRNDRVRQYASLVLERMEEGSLDDELMVFSDPDDPYSDNPFPKDTEEWLIGHATWIASDELDVVTLPRHEGYY